MTTLALATFAMFFTLTLPAAAEQAMDTSDLQTVTGEVAMLTPAVLHLEVDGKIRQFEVTSESELVPGLSTDDYVKVWYREDSMGKVTVETVERNVESSETMAATERSETDEQAAQVEGASESETARSESKLASSSTDARGEEMTSGESTATSTSQQSQTSERSRLPQTASAQPLLLIVGLLAVTLAGGLAILRRS